MELKNTSKKKQTKKPQSKPQPTDYVITHKDVDVKEKTLGFKKLPEARISARIMYRSGTFIKLENAKGTKLTI